MNELNIGWVSEQDDVNQIDAAADVPPANSGDSSSDDGESASSKGKGRKKPKAKIPARKKKLAAKGKVKPKAAVSDEAEGDEAEQIEAVPAGAETSDSAHEPDGSGRSESSASENAGATEALAAISPEQAAEAVAQAVEAEVSSRLSTHEDDEVEPTVDMKQRRQLLVNYVPGEECRVAVVADGKLDEFYSERFDQISRVGNIYVGRVTNVEPAIQAAFVDFGVGINGFLHTSDLHPRYFPGEDGETTERVGKKTPRRERPPIQECLKRGQEIIVQVLKEGVGSKGPTLTSYLSIPGRYLVMMPGMDKVGVSRKVEDEETRAKTKAILDQLELPEGFGFIVRTAGLDKSKSELKRDLGYLMRLQQDMERRRSVGGKPRLLYSESDLLLRCMRDMMTANTVEVVIDSEIGMQRAAGFIQIVSPKATARLSHYTGRTPIFHAFGIEEQVRTMYAREVPLPSGGRLVIDETEALVAIDVNSGKHRDASDSETNALKTNLEAIEEIARQLRLRDMGGIVVNDLIDMRYSRHRAEVKQKFEQLLARDRARTTLLEINDFGTLEMTRQRQRGSHESIHFHSCPSCHGRGVVQKPDSVAAEALRELAAIMDHDNVHKVEMVVHPRIAAELLSSRRRTVARIERTFGKTLSVRLSDAVAPDRVTFYAYDEQGADIEVERLAKFKLRSDMIRQWSADHPTPDVEEVEEQFVLPEQDEVQLAEFEKLAPMTGDAPDASGTNFQMLTQGRGKRGRRGRGGKGGQDQQGQRGNQPQQQNQQGNRPQGGQQQQHRQGGQQQQPHGRPPHGQQQPQHGQHQQQGQRGGHQQARPQPMPQQQGQQRSFRPMAPNSMGESRASSLAAMFRATSAPGPTGDGAGAPPADGAPPVDGAPMQGEAFAGDAGAPMGEGQMTPQGDQPVQFGPDGQPLEQGGRRRRRRRRGGRGRNRGQGGGDFAGQGGQSGQAPMDGGPDDGPSDGVPMGWPPAETSAPVDDDRPAADHAGVERPDAGGDEDAHDESGGSFDDAPHGGGQGGQGQDQGEGGGRRRRRRRRGGRGRGGQGGQGQGGHGSPQQGQHGHGQHHQQPQRGGQHHGGGGGGGSGGQSQPQPRPASPAPTPAPSSTPAQPRRTLYAAFKRLKPGQVPKGGREE